MGKEAEPFQDDLRLCLIANWQHSRSPARQILKEEKVNRSQVSAAFDRIARSTKNFHEIVDELSEMGIEFLRALG
jgi:DNA invertase Pin-like site-specific DNA recombinase